MGGTKDKDWIGTIIDGIKLNSAIYEPKKAKKGNRLADNQFLDDCKYQYLTKYDEEVKKFKAKRAQGFNMEVPEDPRNKKSAAFLMLYKKGLESLCKEHEVSKNGIL